MAPKLVQLWEEVEVEVQNHPDKSIRFHCIEVAKKHNVNSESLRKAYTRKKTRLKIGKSHKAQLLSDEDEHILVGTIMAIASRGTAATCTEIAAVVRKWQKFSVDWEGLTWVSKFCQKYKQFIAPRGTKALADKRADTRTWKTCNYFVDALKKHFAYNHFPPNAVFNVDETRCSYNSNGTLISRRLVKVEDRSKSGVRKSNRVSSRKGRSMSMVPFVNALGECVLVVYVYKANMNKNKQGDWDLPNRRLLLNMPKKHPSRRLRSDGCERYYAFTKSGYVNTELFAKIMKLFQERWKLRNAATLDCLVRTENSIALQKVCFLLRLCFYFCFVGFNGSIGIGIP